MEFILKGLTASNCADVLQFMVNGLDQIHFNNSQVEELLAHKVLQKHISSEVLQGLLQTAAERGHIGYLSILCRFPAVADLNAAAIQLMFVTIMQQRRWDLLEPMVKKLAQHLDDSMTADLLVLAVKNGIPLLQLCELESAKLLQCTTLEYAVQRVLSGDFKSAEGATVIISSHSLHQVQICMCLCLLGVLLESEL